MANPVCFLEFEVDGKPAGRIEVVVRSDVVPKTAQAFVQLCTAPKGEGYVVRTATVLRIYLDHSVVEIFAATE